MAEARGFLFRRDVPSRAEAFAGLTVTPEAFRSRRPGGTFSFWGTSGVLQGLGYRILIS
jgi:hypothetical protein